MEKLVIFLSSFCFLMLTSTVVFSQEWNTEQQEVWKNVETYSELAAKGDIDGFLTYFNDDFCGWRNGAPLPDDLETRIKLIKFFFPATQTLYYDIKPLAIKIYGNTAIVHYYFFNVSSDGEHEEVAHGRWTDILMKQGDKWVMIGDHGGPDPVDD